MLRIPPLARAGFMRLTERSVWEKLGLCCRADDEKEQQRASKQRLHVRCIDYHSGVTAMLPEFRIATHPGQILLAEFLEPLRLTQADLARALRIPLNRVNELV